MIRYRLNCQKGHEFEGWFKGSDAFDGQVRRRLVSCPTCGSTKVSKAIMAPRVARKDRGGSRETAPAAIAEEATQAETGAGQTPDAIPQRFANDEQRKLLRMMRKLREEVLAKSEYVGPRFAEEARKIHNKETEARGIYGEATPAEVRELKEDGVEVHPVPVLPDDHN